MKRTFHSLHFKLFSSDFKHWDHYIWHAEPGRVYLRENIPAAADEFVRFISREFPGHEFTAVRVGPNNYNVLPDVPHA